MEEEIIKYLTTCRNSIQKLNRIVGIVLCIAYLTCILISWIYIKNVLLTGCITIFCISFIGLVWLLVFRSEKLVVELDKKLLLIYSECSSNRKIVLDKELLEAIKNTPDREVEKIKTYYNMIETPIFKILGKTELEIKSIYDYDRSQRSTEAAPSRDEEEELD